MTSIRALHNPTTLENYVTREYSWECTAETVLGFPDFEWVSFRTVHLDLHLYLAVAVWIRAMYARGTFVISVMIFFEPICLKVSPGVDVKFCPDSGFSEGPELSILPTDLVAPQMQQHASIAQREAPVCPMISHFVIQGSGQDAFPNPVFLLRLKNCIQIERYLYLPTY